MGESEHGRGGAGSRGACTRAVCHTLPVLAHVTGQVASRAGPGPPSSATRSPQQNTSECARKRKKKQLCADGPSAHPSSPSPFSTHLEGEHDGGHPGVGVRDLVGLFGVHGGWRAGRARARGPAGMKRPKRKNGFATFSTSPLSLSLSSPLAPPRPHSPRPVPHNQDAVCVDFRRPCALCVSVKSGGKEGEERGSLAPSAPCCLEKEKGK